MEITLWTRDWTVLCIFIKLGIHIVMRGWTLLSLKVWGQRFVSCLWLQGYVEVSYSSLAKVPNSTSMSSLTTFPSLSHYTYDWNIVSCDVKQQWSKQNSTMYSVTCLNRISRGQKYLSGLDRIRITQTQRFICTSMCHHMDNWNIVDVMLSN